MLAPMLPSFLLVVLLVELTPGPNMGWLALLSASEGRRAGFAATAGIGLGLAVIAAASTLGLAQLAHQSALVFDLLRYAGSAFLLWLAWEAWVGEREVSPSTVYRDGTPAKHFRRGLIINLLNPKAAVFFIVVLPGYIVVNQSITMQTLQLSAAYVAIATLIHVVIVLFASQAHGWLTNSPYTGLARKSFAVMLALIALWFFVGTFR
ncbi:MAG: LysE family translocator [Sphingomonadales bacterium]|nr:LysE family translocator [Sphingomonadales bacterium]PIX63795.1 MAG: lysine transporter LysE [Sphingomonadales bacterium CG_4_10_14_3_um_filter_58_15]NCO49145.1 LysE family translocator [Sphingomonadales bacterium]NCP00061.1 LysE family translocator [Sphingomonadales bacterium]NCP27336.1 LysE family translocator [Sphingomonadales bacterium]